MKGVVWFASLAVVTAACGGPATPPTPAPAPPKAVTAAPPKPAAATPTPAVLDPAGTLAAAGAAAGAVSAANVARQDATPGVKAGGPAPLVASPGAVAAAAAPALTPGAPVYEANGRRDPFTSLETREGSQRSTVATAKLTGVIRSGTTTLALVETSDGIGYILKAGDTLADGRLVEVGPDMVVFSVAPKPGVATNRVVLKLASD